MEKEKVCFEERDFESKFEEFLGDNNIFDDYDALRDIIHDDLRKDGLDSKYAYLSEPIQSCSSGSDYYQVNAYMNDISELERVEVYDQFISEYYSKEMKDPEFATDVYSYMYYDQCASNWEFRWFEDLRKDKNGNCKDAVDLDALHKELGIETEKERER